MNITAKDRKELTKHQQQVIEAERVLRREQRLLLNAISRIGIRNNLGRNELTILIDTYQ